MKDQINWLLSSSPWVEYRTQRDLLALPEDQIEVQRSRAAMLSSQKVINLVSEVTNWPGSPLISHKSAGHAIHKLVFLADLGLNIHDPGMQELIDRVMQHQEDDGVFQMLTNIPIHFGGSGTDVWAWALCDAPSVNYALIKFGLSNHPAVQKSVETLTSLVRQNGWPCASSTKYGKFHGPGRKEDPCPYANLIMVKMLAAFSDSRESEACKLGAESLLDCWQRRLTYHPYIFYMGNDFCKLKAPLVWFDILHVVTVLSQLPWLKEDSRLKEMKSIIASKANNDGLFTPESVWMTWKDWGFGQKKTPSAWLTYLAIKALR